MVAELHRPPLGAGQAVHVDGLTHRYGARLALHPLTLSVPTGVIFAILGPNGGGKTTLFRVLSTLIPAQSGRVTILGRDVRRETMEVRACLGVVFQAPSLDRHLTVDENLFHQAALYGLSRAAFRRQREHLLEQMGLMDRRGDRVDTLSGGLRRRVELAKGMLHQPRLLLLDEPSTGLDPGARSDLWRYLVRLRDELQMTIVMTTHLLDEAEKADCVAILSQGRLVALDQPDRLRAEIGGDVVILETPHPQRLADAIRSQFGLPAKVVDGEVRLEIARDENWVPRLVQSFADQLQGVRFGQPTLEDVFIQKTGHRFGDG